MATINQIYAMVNDTAEEIYGEEAIRVKDTATLVSLGDKVLSSNDDKDAFYQTLVDRIGRTVIAVRRYKAKDRSVMRDDMEWGLVYQKISYKKLSASDNPGWVTNTQASPYDIEPQTEAVQKLFSVLSTYQYEDSVPDTQLRTAFTNGSAMGAFISGIYTNMYNALETAEEGLANLAVSTLIAGVLIKGKSAQKRDLRVEYNTFSGENLATYEDCLKSADFYKFATREISDTKKNMETMGVTFNAEDIPRFTKGDKCVLEVLGKFASGCQSYLESNTYHNELIKLPHYEEVTFWQGQGESGFAFDDVSKINIENEHLATDDNADGAIEQGGIVAVLRDYDAVASIITNRRSGSVYNPLAERFNIFEKADKGYAVDLSENAVVFYISEAEAVADDLVEG